MPNWARPIGNLYGIETGYRDWVSRLGIETGYRDWVLGIGLIGHPYWQAKVYGLVLGIDFDRVV